MTISQNTLKMVDGVVVVHLRRYHAAFFQKVHAVNCVCVCWPVHVKNLFLPPPAITDIGYLNMDESRNYDHNSNLYLLSILCIRMRRREKAALECCRTVSCSSSESNSHCSSSCYERF